MQTVFALVILISSLGEVDIKLMNVNNEELCYKVLTQELKRYEISGKKLVDKEGNTLLHIDCILGKIDRTGMVM